MLLQCLDPHCSTGLESPYKNQLKYAFLYQSIFPVPCCLWKKLFTFSKMKHFTKMPHRVAPQLISCNKNVSCNMKKTKLFLFYFVLYETFFEIISFMLQIKTPGSMQQYCIACAHKCYTVATKFNWWETCNN